MIIEFDCSTDPKPFEWDTCIHFRDSSSPTDVTVDYYT